MSIEAFVPPGDNILVMAQRDGTIAPLGAMESVENKIIFLGNKSFAGTAGLNPELLVDIVVGYYDGRGGSVNGSPLRVGERITSNNGNLYLGK